MDKKNVLTALKKQSQDNNNFVLPDSDVKSLIKKPIGRPKKNPKEKRNYKITLSLTQAEGNKVAEKAGLVSEATYIYSILEKTEIFK